MKQNKLMYFFSVIIFLLLANVSCKKSDNTNMPGGNPGGNNTNAVSIQNMAFSPSTITLKAGTKITWTNNDAVAHTVTSDDGTSFNSGTISAGGSFSFTASTAGTFAYHCAIHPAMKATLVVSP